MYGYEWGVGGKRGGKRGGDGKGALIPAPLESCEDLMVATLGAASR